MTANQIAYANLKELERHNRATEKQTQYKYDTDRLQLERQQKYDQETLIDADLKRDQDARLHREGLLANWNINQASIQSRESIASADRDVKEDIATKDRGSRELLATQQIQSNKDIAAMDRASRETVAAEERSSKERIASADRLSREQIASDERASKERIASADRVSRETIASQDRSSRESISSAQLATQRFVASADREARTQLGYAQLQTESQHRTQDRNLKRDELLYATIPMAESRSELFGSQSGYYDSQTQYNVDTHSSRVQEQFVKSHNATRDMFIGDWSTAARAIKPYADLFPFID